MTVIFNVGWVAEEDELEVPDELVLPDDEAVAEEDAVAEDAIVVVADDNRDGWDDTEEVTVGESDGVTVDVAEDVTLEVAELEGVGELQTVSLVVVHAAVIAIPLHELHKLQVKQVVDMWDVLVW